MTKTVRDVHSVDYILLTLRIKDLQERVDILKKREEAIYEEIQKGTFKDLSEVEIQCYWLKEKEGFDLKEICRELEISKVAAQNYLKRAYGIIDASLSVDNQAPGNIDKSDLQPLRPSIETADLQILAEQVKPHSGSPVDDLADTDNRVDLKDAEIEELKKQIVWLEERHVKDTARIDESNAKRYEEIARADNWRDKCRLTEIELRDTVCEIEKLKQQHDIEIRNLQNDARKANEALELHHQDEQLLFQTMKKLVTVSDRLNETVEGGKDLWR